MPIHANEKKKISRKETNLIVIIFIERKNMKYLSKTFLRFFFFFTYANKKITEEENAYDIYQTLSMSQRPTLAAVEAKLLPQGEKWSERQSSKLPEVEVDSRSSSKSKNMSSLIWVDSS